MQKELLARDKERAERNEMALTKLQKPGVAAIHALDHEFDPTPLTRAIYERRARDANSNVALMQMRFFALSYIYTSFFFNRIYIRLSLYRSGIRVCIRVMYLLKIDGFFSLVARRALE